MPQPQDHAGSTDDQPRVPWARRSAAALGWVIGFAVAIGLVVAAVMIPTAFVVNTASADDGASDDASAMTEETELPDEAMQKVTLEAAARSGGSVEWEVDGQVETEEFSDSWSKEIEIPSGSWPRLVVTGDPAQDGMVEQRGDAPGRARRQRPQVRPRPCPPARAAP